MSGKCRKINHSEIRLSDGTRFTYSALLEFFLGQNAKNGFDCQKAITFCEAQRKLLGWSTYTDYPISQWIERVVVDPFFIIEGDRWSPKFVKRNDVNWQLVNQDEILRFMCYVGVCYSKYGASYDSLNTDRMFDWVTQLGSDEPERIKKEGSGLLPKNLTDIKTELITFKANDVFATIRLIIKKECEEAYSQALDAINHLIEPDNHFPGSYGIHFRSPEKAYLPIKGLPKKGVNQLFTQAVRYPALFPKIEKYAQLAMKEDEWYTNLGDNTLMPSSFAVFALGLVDEKYFTLVQDYMHTCDDEHSSLQMKFTIAFIEKYGFTTTSLPVFISSVLSFQNPEHAKIFAKKAALHETQELLYDYKLNPEKYLSRIILEESNKKDISRIWDTVITTVYGCRSSRDTKIPERLRSVVG